MGGLVLVFGGLLTFSVIQKSRVSDGAFVSQVSEPSSAVSGPNAEQYDATSNVEALTGNANSAANTVANLAPNLNAAANSNALGGLRSAVASNSNAPADRFVSDGAEPVVAPPPATVSGSATQPSVREDRDDLAKAKTEEKATIAPQEQAKVDTVAKDRYAGVPAQSGPMRNNENQYNRQLENLDRRAAAKKAQAAERDEESSSGRRVVAGKTFERKQGVWYDVNYQGRPTINVRRGSDEYNRLDAGLRSIANSLNGTVVIVWGAKAYRVQ
jgi:hypothetical protein